MTESDMSRTEAAAYAKRIVAQHYAQATEIVDGLKGCALINDMVGGGEFLNRATQDPGLFSMVMGMLVAQLVQAEAEMARIQASDVANAPIFTLGADEVAELKERFADDMPGITAEVDQLSAALAEGNLQLASKISVDGNITHLAPIFRRALERDGEFPDITPITTGLAMADRMQVLFTCAEALRRLVIQEVSP